MTDVNKEPLCEYLTLTMTPSERTALETMAYAHGATLRGFIRKLIREAYSKHERIEVTQGAGSGRELLTA